MTRQEILDALYDMDDNYRYYMTFIENTKEALEDQQGDLNPFEKQLVNHILEALKSREDNMQKAISALKSV